MLRKILAIILGLCIPFSMAGCAAPQGGSEPEAAKAADSEEEDRAFTGQTPDGVKIDLTVTVSPMNADSFGFDGWGTSLCWWANRLGYSDSLAQQSADLFFGEDGLKMNIMRYNIGGGDDPSHKHITRTDSAVPGWLYYDEATGEYVYDETADENQLNVLKRCAEAAGENALVEVFSNSPPYFMTVSGCSSGGYDPNLNNLKEDCYGDFADYLAHVADVIQNKMGVKVTSISPMNEPNTNYWGANSYKQEGCHFDAGKAQSEIITELAAAMKNYDLSDVIIAASDETDTGKQLDEYNSYSDEAKKVIGRINTHTYGTDRIAGLGELAKSEGFKLWMSEVDGNGTAGENAGEMGSAIWFGSKIISDLNALTPSAWVMWQAIDNHVSSEGYNGNRDSGMVDTNGGFWGLAVADHDSDEIILTQKYYAMGQFTRFIRPGMKLIHCGANSLAAINGETGELAITVINPTASDKTANIDLSQFSKMGRSAAVTRTSGDSATGEHWASLGGIDCYDGGFVAELKANSVTTFLLEDCEMGEIKLSEISLKSAKVSGSAPWNNGADVAEKVFDGDVASFFDGVSEGWLEADLGKKIEFDVLGFAPRGGFEARMLGGTFYGSSDGKNWEEIYVVTSSPAAGMNYFFLPEAKKYRYLRYDTAHSEELGGESLANIAEIKLYTKSK